MGVKLNLITGAINGEPMIVRTLAEIEDGLKDVDDPAVRKEDDGESQGLLPLLRKLVPTDPPPTWEVALALSVAFGLGRYAAGGKIDAESLARLGGMARGAQRKAEADRAWRNDAKQIWRDTRGSRAKGDPGRKSQDIVAEIICREVTAAPEHDRVVKTIRNWDRGAS
jgi:hypothetical protein